jgi:hypothetical protein
MISMAAARVVLIIFLVGQIYLQPTNIVFVTVTPLHLSLLQLLACVTNFLFHAGLKIRLPV